MRIIFDFASVRMGIISLLVCLLLFPAVPHTAMVSPQPMIVNSPNHFRAEYSRPNSSPPVPVQSDKPQLMAATYYSLQGKLRTSISLNNKGIFPLEVRPTLFNLAGERLDVPAVTVDATSFRVFDLAEWAALGGQSFLEGSLQLFYRGNDLLLGAQIKMIDSEASLIFDEQLTEPNSMRSSRLEGLWRMPDHNPQLHIAISNTSDLRQVALIKVEGIAPQQQESRELILEPHQTLVIDPTQELSDSPITLMEAGGISITHSGRPGSLIARTMIANPATGYSSSMQLVDPGKSRSSKLHGAGLRLGLVAGEEMTPVITWRNIGDRTTTVRGRIYYTTNEGKQAEMSLRDVRLNAGEVKTWEISEVAVLHRAGIKSAGVEFDYDTQPGSVIVSAQSVSSKGSHVFQVPLLDPKAQTSSTGVYPFYLDYGSTTVVYIKNTTDKEQNFIAHLNYEGGRYQMGVRSISPGETAAIDIRSLRDNQVEDEEGRTIPSEIARGQARWTIIQREGTDLLALIGRAEHIDVARGLSSTYACQNCCGDFVVDASVTQPQGPLVVGETVQLLAFETRADCYGFTYPIPQAASWSSSNNSVATVSGGQVTTVGAGQATITATWNSHYSAATQCASGPGFGPGPIEPVVCCESRSQIRFPIATLQIIDFTITLSSTFIHPAGTGGSNTSTVRVRTNPQTPNLGITLTLADVLNAGGHLNHSGQRPVGTLSATQGMTGADGSFQATYTAPIFGGEVAVIAAVVGSGVNKGELVVVRVPGLGLLGEGENHNLIGQTPTHPSNHWGTTTALSSLVLIASDYRTRFYGENPIPAMERIGYNDMSLVFGGKFEIAGNWGDGPHAEHRVGINCDVRSSNIPANRHQALEDMFRARGSRNFLDEGNHWHLRFQ